MANKGNFGHLGGACGSAELIFAIKSMETGCIPPILNLENPLDVDINYVRETVTGANINYALKNS